MNAVFNWSGGKDSALALYKVLQEKKYNVVALLTTVNRKSERSSMHAIPVSLLKKQAEAIGIPLYIVELEPEGDINDYEIAMKDAVDHFKRQNVEYFIFGDIFLHDVKTYREERLNPYGITVIEPLWGKTSEDIMVEFLASGLKTIIVTTMADVLGEEFIGRTLNNDLISELPDNADVCGENGEYHTFCYDGPIFSYPVSYSLGKPLKMTFPVKMDDGEIKSHSYWFANLQDEQK